MRAPRYTTSLISLYVERGVWLLPLAVLLYTAVVLALNFDRSIDITDEGYYILWAHHPEDVLAEASQFGHYTGVLYSLAGGSLALFRLLGLLLLLIVTGLFAFSLQRYWRTVMPLPPRSQWISLPVILASTLVYYGVFTLWTPSYNWLALVGALLTAAGLLQAAAYEGRSKTSNPHTLGLFGQGVLVGIGGALAFIAKPSTAGVLALIFLYWIVATPLRHRWKVFLLTSAFSSFLFLMMHAFVFENGPESFYTQIKNGLALRATLLEGYSFKSLSGQALVDLLKLPGYVLKRNWIAPLLLLGVFIHAKIRGRRWLPFERVLIFGLAFAGIIAWLQLWAAEIWLGGPGHGTRIGSGVLSFSLILAFSSAIAFVFLKANEGGSTQFKPMAALYLFLTLLPIAYSFGTLGGLMRGTSGAFVFYSAAALSFAYWLDGYMGKRFFGHATQLLLVLSVTLIVTSSFKNPYRSPGTIYDQNVPVTFVGSESRILVDNQTAGYINGLKNLALSADWKQDTPLIDMTGGSPGATVILDGRAPGFPWLVGQYEGSDKFVYKALLMAPRAMIENAWILTAPAGKRSISAKVLTDLGLNFPSAYESLGTVTSGHRNEEQILWRPVR